MADKQLINKLEPSLVPQRSAEEICDVFKGGCADCETSESLA